MPHRLPYGGKHRRASRWGKLLQLGLSFWICVSGIQEIPIAWRKNAQGLEKAISGGWPLGGYHPVRLRLDVAVLPQSRAAQSAF